VPSAQERINRIFFALTADLHKGDGMATMTQEDLSNAVLKFVKDSCGRVRFRVLSGAMETQGFTPDDTADAVNALERSGILHPGAGGWVTLP
jgi:hypothetical protein